MSDDRVIGRDVTVTLSTGEITEWDSIKFADPSEDFEATAASAARKQFVDGQDGQAILTITGFLGGDTLPTKNAVVSSIDIGLAVGDLPVDFSDDAYGVWKVKNPSFDLAAGPGKYSFEIKSNYLA